MLARGAVFFRLEFYRSPCQLLLSLKFFFQANGMICIILLKKKANMKIAISLFVCLLIPLTSFAAENIVPRLSGYEFLERYFGKAGSVVNDEQKMFNRQFSRAYIAGVADFSQGTAWCDTTSVKTIEIDADIAHALREMPSDVLKKDAARSIVKILAKEFPCH